MKLINEKPYSPRKEEIVALLAAEKWRNVLAPHLKKRDRDDAPKDGRPFFLICNDGSMYPAYYGLAKDSDGDPVVEKADSDEDFPWVVFDPMGETSAVETDEIKYWLEFPTP